MRKFYVCTLLIASAALAACNKAEPKEESIGYFDPAASEGDVSRTWTSESPWKGLPAGSRIAITEFVVEYVTETTHTNRGGADELLGMNKKKNVFSERFKQRFPTTLYNEFVSALQAQGFAVVSIADITKEPALRFWELQPESQTSDDSDNSASEIQTYHVHGLPVAPTGAGIFNADDNLKAEMQAVVHSGAVAALHVHIRLGLDGRAHAVLSSGSSIHIAAHPYQTTTGWANSETVYRTQTNATLISSSDLRDQYPVIINQEYKAFEGNVQQIDSTAFQQAIERLYPTFAKAAAEAIKG